MRLAQELDCFPPSLIAKPFSHLLEIIDLLPPFDLGAGAVDIKEAARKRVQSAIEQFEAGATREKESAELPPAALSASELLGSGEYDKVIQVFAQRISESDEIATAVASAYRSRGYAQTRLAANSSDDEEIRFMLDRAEQDYRAAVEVGTNLPPRQRAALLNGLVYVLLLQGTLTNAFDSGAPLLEAEKLATKTHELLPGRGAYNLACLAAIRQDEEGCRSWLKAAKEGTAPETLPPREHMLNDPDLAVFRDTDWFREFIASLP